VVDVYVKAIEDLDLDRVAEIMHPDVVGRYPQSGETFRGRDNYLAMLAAYPGLPHTHPTSVTGEEEVVILPSFLPFGAPTITVFGGDRFVVEGIATYPDGEIYNVVVILRVQAGAIIEETTYFASPFEPAEWRRPYVD
jgi:hypothetical protein